MALFTKKIWKNRMSEYPTRRKLTKENGTTELVTVARSEGIVSQEGDAFSADNMNSLEDRIQAAIGSGDLPAGLGADIISAINALNTGLGVKKQVIVSKNIKLTTTVGPVNGFYTGSVSLGDFDLPFETVPKVFGSPITANGMTVLIGITNTTKASWGTAYFMSNFQRTNMDMTINLIAIQSL